jgi:hypothetical protein
MEPTASLTERDLEKVSGGAATTQFCPYCRAHYSGSLQDHFAKMHPEESYAQYAKSSSSPKKTINV